MAQITLTPKSASETAKVQAGIKSGRLKTSNAGSTTTTRSIYEDRLDVGAYNQFVESEQQKYQQEFLTEQQKFLAQQESKQSQNKLVQQIQSGGPDTGIASVMARQREVARTNEYNVAKASFEAEQQQKFEALKKRVEEQKSSFVKKTKVGTETTTTGPKSLMEAWKGSSQGQLVAKSTKESLAQTTAVQDAQKLKYAGSSVGSDVSESPIKVIEPVAASVSFNPFIQTKNISGEYVSIGDAFFEANKKYELGLISREKYESRFSELSKLAARGTKQFQVNQPKVVGASVGTSTTKLIYSNDLEKSLTSQNYVSKVKPIDTRTNLAYVDKLEVKEKGYAPATISGVKPNIARLEAGTPKEIDLSQLANKQYKEKELPYDIKRSLSISELKVVEPTIQKSRQALGGQLYATALAGSFLVPPAFYFGGAATATQVIGVSAFEGAVLGGLEPVARTGELNPFEIGGGAIVGGATGAVVSGAFIAGGKVVSKLYPKAVEFVTPKIVPGSEQVMAKTRMTVGQLSIPTAKSVNGRTLAGVNVVPGASVKMSTIRMYKETSPLKQFLGYAPDVKMERFETFADIVQKRSVSKDIKIQALGMMPEYNQIQAAKQFGYDYKLPKPLIKEFSGKPYIYAKRLDPEALNELVAKRISTRGGLRGVQEFEVSGYTNVIKGEVPVERTYFNEVASVYGKGQPFVRVKPTSFIVKPGEEIPSVVTFGTRTRQFGDEVVSARIIGTSFDSMTSFKQLFTSKKVPYEVKGSVMKGIPQSAFEFGNIGVQTRKVKPGLGYSIGELEKAIVKKGGELGSEVKSGVSKLLTKPETTTQGLETSISKLVIAPKVVPKPSKVYGLTIGKTIEQESRVLGYTGVGVAEQTFTGFKTPQLKYKVIEDVKTKQLQEFKYNDAVAFKNIQLNETKNKLLDQTKVKDEVQTRYSDSTSYKYYTPEGIKVAQLEAIKFAQPEAIKYREAEATKLITPEQFKFKTPFKIIETKLPLPKLPRKPRYPEMKEKTPTKKYTGYIAFIRKKGKVVQVSREPLSYGLALQAGKRATRAGLSQSFFIKTFGYTKYSDMQAPSLAEYRLKKPTSKIREQVFIEKNPLATREETRLLQQAKKSKRSLFG